MFKLIAVAAGLFFAARALSQRTSLADRSWSPEPAPRVSEEEAEQELRTPTS